jgi:hypothetical protein
MSDQYRVRTWRAAIGYYVDVLCDVSVHVDSGRTPAFMTMSWSAPGWRPTERWARHCGERYVRAQLRRTSRESAAREEPA